MPRALTALVGGVVLAACSGGSSVRSAHPTAVTSTPAPSAVAGATTSSPTTTVPAPPTTLALAPQKSPDLAAMALLNAWRTGDHQAALSVATPSAVSAIFMLPPQVFSDRGCQTPLNGMASCAFGIGGQAAIVQVLTVALGGGWVVQSVATTPNN